MAVIHVLDQHTAELIAAGEVVERPASVVKELLENAVDAGASQVTVTIERGGVQLIEVADNGSGIDTKYVPTAFIRHATSKIRTESDLENIHTLGFRGEALASIASVARVELLTCTPEDEFACLYRIEGGQEKGMEAAARPVGTTITVRDLFYNTPARMKFLKKDSTEGTYVAETVQRVALSHPEVSVRFVREGKVQFRTPGDGSRQSAAHAVLGREFARDLLAADAAVNACRVTGLITPPRACRASRSMQFFFINGRFVKNRTMMAALEAAYKGTLMQGKFPGCVLELTMPPELVDVNVHPAKTEVRFARESEVFDAVYKAVKLALEAPGSGEQRLEFAKQKESSPAPQPLKTEAQPAPIARAAMPAAPRQKIAESAVKLQGFTEEVSRSARPWQPATGGFASQPLPYGAPVRSEPSLDILVEESEGPLSPKADPPAPVPATSLPEQEPEAPAAAAPWKEPAVVSQPESKPEQLPQPEQTALPGIQPQTEPLRLVGEVFRTYIVAQRGDEVCFIDKHAAHERILYEQLVARRGAPGSQMLLTPVTVQLSAAEKSAVLHHREMLAENGVETDDFGGSAVLVRSVPADIPPDDVEDLVVELADRLITNSRQALTEKAEWVLHSIACRAAVKAGDRSRPEELLALAQQILDGEVPPFCPHGRPVILKLTRKELEKQFGRQG